MGNEKPSFAEDLRSIDQDVETDLKKLVRLAKTVQADGQTSTATPVARKPITQDAFDEQPKVINSNHRSNRARDTKDDNRVVYDPTMRENVTTRLTKRTNELLTEASLKQRLKKQKPDTRQDIIESAVLDWLKRSNYL